MLFAQTVSKSVWFDFSGWPQWAIVLVATLAAVVLIWVFMKLMKVALWIFLFVVLVAGLGWAGWLLLK